MAKPYGLWKRSNGLFYYRLPGGEWKSTGHSRKGKAIEYVLERIEEAKTAAARSAALAGSPTLRDYLKPFYRWESCPHIARLLAEKKQISRQHADHQRTLIDKYILTDPIADMRIRELRRGHILDFRRRILAKTTDRQANRILGVLKACLKEGIYREELERDPTAGIGNIREEKRERGTFSREELRALFPADGLGPWPDLQAFACFLFAATVGARRGEILALRWGDLDLTGQTVSIRRAWKSDRVLGKPKWEKVREGIPLPEVTARRLRELRKLSVHVLPDALVFHETDGRRKSGRWWQETFRAAMEKHRAEVKKAAGAPFDWKARNLKPHSMRHSLATLLKDEGIDDLKIRALLGWSSEKTQAGYTHTSAMNLRDQAAIIDSLFS